MTIPRASARLQFHDGFTLDDAVPLVEYFAALGVSHLYASPLTQARAGSTHGYDTTDYSLVSPALGGEAALRRLVARLREAGMGLILDIVPNHMSTHFSNAWWWDVLKWGMKSRYARYFDIDWESPDPQLRGKLLAPFLGKPYAEELAAGNIRLHFDAERGDFHIAYFDNLFALTPLSYPGIFKGAAQSVRMVALTRLFGALEENDETRHREAASEVLRQAAHMPELHAAIQAAVDAHDPRYPQGRQRLHRLLERQNYRLTWWRNAAEEINWRRFFEITDLAGLRIEDAAVFDAVHELVLRLYREGLIDGVRIDHVDGLTDPQKYCLALRAALGAETPHRPPALRQAPYLVVEKILAEGEQLDGHWRTDGTTGYDFMGEVGGLLHDARGEAALGALWQTLSGDTRSFADIVYDARRLMLEHHFAGEFENLSRAVHGIAQLDIATRDWSLPAVRRVLKALLAAFPVYRTYAGIGGRTVADQSVFSRAASAAADTLATDDRQLLALVGQWLGGEAPYAIEPGPQRQARLEAIRRFQQLTAPLAAKSVEDTAFFRYGRLLSRNEVGADPAAFAIEPALFHELAARRARQFPHAMLATATHDHKRGEDARCRLAVLSEMASSWSSLAGHWLSREAGDPHPVDQYMLFQTLIAAWPLELAAEDREGVDALRERVAQWQVKSLREGKLRSGWFAPDTAYEDGCAGFLARRLADAGFVRELIAFVDTIAPAAALKGLSQCMLRLTCPGMPDLYQGTEFWDFSLTDPDNRRPVDYAARMQALSAHAAPAALLKHWRDGRVKQALIRQLLQYRQAHAALFAQGDYQPLPLRGPGAQHAIAFHRQHEGQSLLVVATRLCTALPGADPAHLPKTPLVSPADWGATTLSLPPSLAGATLRSVLDGKLIDAPQGELPLCEVLSALPGAVLEPTP